MKYVVGLCLLAIVLAGCANGSSPVISYDDLKECWASKETLAEHKATADAKVLALQTEVTMLKGQIPSEDCTDIKHERDLLVMANGDLQDDYDDCTGKLTAYQSNDTTGTLQDGLDACNEALNVTQLGLDNLTVEYTICTETLANISTCDTNSSS